MVDLKATTPCAGLLPIGIGTVQVEEVAPTAMTLIMPYRGAPASFVDQLPQHNRTTVYGGGRLQGFGRGQVMLIGAQPDPNWREFAALVDQSDAWAHVRVRGAGAEDVLSRLIPIDLRLQAFPVGHAARSMVKHMTGSVTRMGDQVFELMVFRSMAVTLVHDLKSAMAAVATRG